MDEMMDNEASTSFSDKNKSELIEHGDSFSEDESFDDDLLDEEAEPDEDDPDIEDDESAQSMDDSSNQYQKTLNDVNVSIYFKM